MAQLLFLATMVLAQGPAISASTNAGVEDALRRAKNEYAYGNYEKAVEQLRGLLYPMRLSTDTQVIEARKYLALSYYLLDRLDEVGEEFAKLLHLDPDYELDPFIVAPPIIEMFESIRRQLKPELDIVRQLKSDRTLKKPVGPGTRREIERRFTEQSELATFLPFGVGQFQNGQTEWGLMFAVSEGLMLIANIAAYVYSVQVVGNGYSADERSLVQGLAIAQYSSLALFGLTWSVGVFHARLHFVGVTEGPPVVRDLPTGPTPPGPGALLTIPF